MLDSGGERTLMTSTTTFRPAGKPPMLNLPSLGSLIASPSPKGRLWMVCYTNQKATVNSRHATPSCDRLRTSDLNLRDQSVMR